MHACISMHISAGRAPLGPQHRAGSTTVRNFRQPAEDMSSWSEPCLCVDQTSLMASGVPMPAARGSPAGPNQWFCGAPAFGGGGGQLQCLFDEDPAPWMLAAAAQPCCQDRVAQRGTRRLGVGARC